MKSAMTAISAAGVFALAAISIPNDAQAQSRGCGLGLGIAGGLVAGAIIGGAIARSSQPFVRLRHVGSLVGTAIKA